MVWSPSRIVGNFLASRLSFWLFRWLAKRHTDIPRDDGQDGVTRDIEARLRQQQLQHFASRRIAWQRARDLQARWAHKEGAWSPTLPPAVANIRQTITVTLDNTDLHLISYYTMADWRAGKLGVSVYPGQPRRR